MEKEYKGGVTIDIEEIIKRAQRGDDDAFQQLILIETPKLYKIAFIYVKNEPDALDILQDAIYKAYISIHKLKFPDHFTTWIIRILINTAIDHLKKRQHVLPLNEEILIKSYSENNSQIEDRVVLSNAIDLLEEKYKSVIILKYFKDFSNQQIAEVLGYPIGTVKTYLHRSIKELKTYFKEGYCHEKN
ncbi:MAG: sigma-70 family RNA polymerase sigma factor [Paenibacillaceae bacterium]